MSVIITIIAAFVVAVVLWAIYLGRPAPAVNQIYAVSFSAKQTDSLNLKMEDVYLAILDELGVKKIRLSAYWDVIEPASDKFDFKDLDWQIDEAERHDAKVLLAVGRKLPRWPECFMPDWARGLGISEQNERVIKMVRTVIERYRHRQIIVAWQLENEPFVKWFGECPKPDSNMLRKELALVRELSNKPVVITDSGELSTWRRAANFADYFGTTMYRVTWNPYYGYGFYPLPPAFYRMKARLWDLEPAKILITELQAEPWPPGKSLIDTSLDEQSHSLDLQRLRRNISFARQTGFGEVYLWGAEWWYWLKEKQNHPEFWEEAKTLF